MSDQKRGGIGYRLFTSIWSRKWFLFACALIVGAYVSLTGVSNQLCKATTYIKLNFESAHDGLTPGGTRFNIYDMQREELMTKALEMTGLSDALTWRELADLLTIAPSRTQSVSKRYIATEYTASIMRSDAFGTVGARSMLDVICRLYYEDFLNQSGMKQKQLDVDWSVIENMEYIEAGEYVQSRTDILRQFIENRISMSRGYESDDTASSFRALLSTVKTYESVYISKYMALVQQGNLFRDADAYHVNLNYQRMLLNQDYQYSRAQFAIREKALTEYQESLIAIVMVPTYYQGNGLYMSRTQTGIDILTKEAESYSFISQSQALKLEKIEKEIESIARASMASAEKADALFEEVMLNYDKLAASVKRADEAYITFTARDYFTFTPRTMGLIDAYSIKDAFIFAAIAVFLLSLSFFMYDTRKRAHRRPIGEMGGSN